MARKGYGRPSTLVNITTHADDGSSPVGSNEWNANPKTDGIFGLTKSTQAISSNDIDVTDSYIEVTNAGDIYTLSAVTTSLPSANYASDSASSISEGDLIYIVKAAGVGTVNLKHQNGGAGAGKITTLTAGDKALSATVPTILMARTISSALEWVEFGGSDLGGSITNDELADMAANTIKVRNSSSSGAPSDIALATTQILIGDGTGFTAAALSGDVTMDNTGDVTVGTLNQSTTGSAATLTTTRAIGGVNFNGSAAIDLPGVNSAGNQATSGLAATATLAASATALATARTIGGVSFNGTAAIDLPGVNTSGTQATSGLAATSTLAAQATTVTCADNTANETVYPTFVDGATGAQDLETDTGLNYNPSTGLLSAVGLTLSGDLTVNGTTTTLDTTNLLVEDKNIVIGSVDTPSESTADGGGITLKGLTDKTITWTNATDDFDISENVDIASAKDFKVAGTSVLNATTLGAGVLASSLTSVGAIATGSWAATPVASAYLDADTQHLSVAQTVTGKKTFGGAGAVGKLAVAGTTSGSTIIDATASAGSGTVTLPTTGTLATLDGSETLTGKSIVATQLTGTIADARMPDLTGAITTVAGAVDTTLSSTLNVIGTQQQWIPAGAWGAVETNGAEFAELELATNDIMLQTFDFDTTTSEKIQFWWHPASNWNAGTVTFQTYWTAASGSGTFIATLAGHSLADSDAIDAALGGTASTTTDTLITANDVHISPISSAVTINGATKNEPVVLQLSRDISDTLGVDAKLIGVKIIYTIDTATSS